MDFFGAFFGGAFFLGLALIFGAFVYLFRGPLGHWMMWRASRKAMIEVPGVVVKGATETALESGPDGADVPVDVRHVEVTYESDQGRHVTEIAVNRVDIALEQWDALARNTKKGAAVIVGYYPNKPADGAIAMSVLGIEVEAPQLWTRGAIVATGVALIGVVLTVGA